MQWGIDELKYILNILNILKYILQKLSCELSENYRNAFSLKARLKMHCIEARSLRTVNAQSVWQ